MILRCELFPKVTMWHSEQVLRCLIHFCVAVPCQYRNSNAGELTCFNSKCRWQSSYRW